MLRVIVGFALLGALLVGLESYRSEQLQGRRNAEQRELLARLEALGRPVILQLAADWRLLYPEPDKDRLQELRDLARHLQADPASLATPDAMTAQSTPVLPTQTATASSPFALSAP